LTLESNFNHKEDEMKTYQFALYTELRKPKSEYFMIYLCLEIGNIRRYYSTGILVKENLWDHKSQRLKGDEQLPNARLNDLENRVRRIIHELNFSNPYWHYLHFEDKFRSKIKVANAYDFLWYMLEKAKEMNDTAGSIQFRETLAMLQRFEWRFEEKTFSYITRNFMFAWNQWMRERISDPQRVNHIKTLGLCMYMAEKEGKLPENKNPFRGKSKDLNLAPRHFQ